MAVEQEPNYAYSPGAYDRWRRMWQRRRRGLVKERIERDRADHLRRIEELETERAGALRRIEELEAERERGVSESDCNSCIGSPGEWF